MEQPFFSGLDSTSALQLVRLLKDLAGQGKTIITSIHQPSSQIFALFDKNFLLSGGKVILAFFNNFFC